MWSEFLVGEHYSTDMAIVAGEPIWFSHTKGIAGPEQTWDYWEVNMPGDDYLRRSLTDFVKKHLSGYSGMANIETIGEKIIEVHLRFSEQWPDLYGPWFLSSLVDLYQGKKWSGSLLLDGQAKRGFSVPRFDDEKYARQGTISDEILRGIERALGVSSITMAYDPDLPLKICARPPGGFRIAWVNGFDLDACFEARQMIQQQLHKLSYGN